MSPEPRAGGLLGVGEAADLLGVSKQRVRQLVRAGQFPEPVARLRATPVWREEDVRASPPRGAPNRAARSLKEGTGDDG